MSLSTRWRAIMVLGAAILLSLGGVAVGCWTKQPADGARGGALAVALSIFLLFLPRDLASRYFTILVQKVPKAREVLDKLNIETTSDGTAAKDRPAAQAAEARVAALEAFAKGLQAKLDIEASAQDQQTLYLAFASLVGTLFWGFGDVVVTKILPHLS